MLLLPHTYSPSQVLVATEAEEDAARLLKGRFGLDDLLKQLKTIQKMGPLREVFSKMPMFGGMADQVDEGELGKVESMIHSMTRKERSEPDIINKSRAQRIARGSGRRPKEVLDLVDRVDDLTLQACVRWGGVRSCVCGRRRCERSRAAVERTVGREMTVPVGAGSAAHAR